jgi:uncharacterized delta-60 repeat protein
LGGTNDDFWTVKFKADGSGVAWRASFDKAGGSDQATAVAVDANNDVIVTGFVWNGVNKDIQTIKYSGITGTVIWQHTFNGTANGNDIGTSVAVDSLNNVYVGGYSQNAAGNDDYIILKYSPTYPDTNGVPVWQATYNGAANGNDHLASLTAGVNGIAATGQSWNGTTFDMLTVKYDFNGTKLWEARYSAPGGAQGKKVRMDSNGNVIATGSAGNGTDLDIYTAKYSSDAAAGTSPPAPTLLWQVTYNGAYDDEPYGLDMDPSGDVYVTGYTWTLTGTNDFYTARYNGASGALVWQQIFDSGVDNTDVAIAVSAAVDPTGDLFVTGYTVAAGISSFQTIKYKRDSGNQLWQATFTGTASMNSRPVGIGLSPTGEVLVAGWGDTASNGLDYYVVKYDPGLLNPPTNLTATTQPDLSIQLAWTDNSNNEDGFAVERRLGENGTYVQIATVPPNTTSYTDPAAGLSPNNYYYYRVRAYNAANGNSHYSNEAHAPTVFVNFLPPAWSYLYNGPDNMDDYANAVAVGPDNNPVVTGYSLRTVGGFDYYTVKLNRADKSVIWSDLYDDVDSEMDVAKCVTVDANNNAIVSGFSQLYYAPAQKNINSIYTIKYPAAGPPQMWGAQYNGPGAIDDRAVAIATTTDTANNVVVIGYGKNAASNDDIYVVKYNSDGTKAWAATPFDAGVGGDDLPSAVAVAPDGSVYVTGYSEKGPSAGVYNFFTAKYNGTTGALIWSDIYSVNAGGDNQANALVVDANGDVYVTGFATNTGGNKDFYTIKYSGTAAMAQRLWERAFDGPAHGDDVAIGVKVDPIDGNIVVAGTSVTNPGDHDITLIRYTASGDLVWQQTLQRPTNDDYAVAMTVDPSGYIYVAGNTSNGSTMDIVSLIYNYDGTFLQASAFNGAANLDDEASSIAANFLGEAFIAGYSTNASGNADYVVLKQTNNYILVPAPFTAIPQADYGKVNLSWGNNTAGAGFHIERTLGPVSAGSVWTLINTAAAGTTSFQDMGLNPGTNYCYRIEAFNGSLASRKIITCATTTLATPVMNQLSLVSATAIDVSWGNVAGNTGFKLERSLDNSSWTQIGGNLAANTTLYHDAGLTAGTVYYYRVSTLNSAGASLTSGVQIAPVLSAPSGVTSGNVTLTWPAVSGITGYKIERSTDNATWTQIAAPLSSATTYSDTTVASGVLYYYRLKATTSAGDSTPSLVQSAMTNLKSPTISSAAASSTTQIAVTWTDPNNNETGYTLEYGACSYNDPTTCANVTIDSYFGSWTAVNLAANTTTTTIGSLTAGRTYRFRVTATLSGANSNPSTYVAGTTNLAAPTNLTATAATSSSVTLNWTDGIGETNYRVLQNGAVLTGTGLPLAQNSATYTVTGLSLNTQYCFQVEPYNSTSYADSNQACVTLYGPPTLNSVTVGSQTQVTLNWTDVAGEVGFDVQQSSAYNQSSPPASPTTGSWNAYTNLTPTPLATGTTSYIVSTGLSAGYTYKYKIRYKLSDGSWSAFSSEIETTTTPQVPSPYNVTPTSTSQLTFNWGDNYGETAYNVAIKQRTTSNCSTDDWTGIASTALAANTTSYTAPGLTQGTTYCFRLNASNAGSTSAWSSILTQTTLLPAPTLNTLTGVTQSAISLSWSGVTGNYGYKIERSTDNSSWSQVATMATTSANPVTYTDNNLAPNQIYYYRVSTNNSAGVYSTPSNVQSATTLAVSVPTLNSLTGITTSQITLNWGPVTGNAGYKVERSPDNTTWTTVNYPAVNATTYTDTGLTAGTLYYYRVSTKNSIDYYSSPSNVLSATTTPAAPSLTVAGVSASQNNLTWQVMLGATSYKVLRSIGSGGPWTQVANPSIAYTTLYCGYYTSATIGCPTLVPAYTTYSDLSLTENTQYCYQLKASNVTGGDSAPSSTVCQKTPAVGGPNLANVTALNSEKIQLTWTYDPNACTPSPCATPDGFEIWKQLVSGDWAKIATVPNSTSYTDTIGIDPFKTYNYQIRAYKGSDESAYSNVMGVTTPAYASGDNTCNFTTTVVTNGPGAITAIPPGVPVSCGTNQSCSAYCAGAQVTFNAVPSSGANFVGWGGNCTGSATSCTITIDANKSITGTFQ